jgi:hypothetical protein
MTKASIKGFIRYWTAAKLVAFEQINSVADVAKARRFCAVMRNGVFANVTDAQIWEALCANREGLLAA